MGTEGDALVVEDVADGLREGMDVGGRAVDGERDGLVEVGDTGTCQGKGTDDAELGNASNRTNVHGYSKFVTSDSGTFPCAGSNDQTRV